MPSPQKSEEITEVSGLLAQVLSASNVSLKPVDLNLFHDRVKALSRLGTLLDNNEIENSPEMWKRITESLRLFVRGDKATPQIGSTPTRDVEIHWLAGGYHAIIMIESNGAMNFFAEDCDGREITEEDIDASADIPEDLISEFRAFLRVISDKAVSRL